MLREITTVLRKKFSLEKPDSLLLHSELKILMDFFSKEMRVLVK
jgi:hypothetical protein